MTAAIQMRIDMPMPLGAGRQIGQVMRFPMPEARAAGADREADTGAEMGAEAQGRATQVQPGAKVER